VTDIQTDRIAVAYSAVASRGKKKSKKTRTSETLSDRLRAAVHRNAAVFELARGFDRILLPYNLMMTSNGSRFNRIGKHTHTQTNADLQTDSTENSPPRYAIANKQLNL